MKTKFLMSTQEVEKHDIVTCFSIYCIQPTFNNGFCLQFALVRVMLKKSIRPKVYPSTRDEYCDASYDFPKPMYEYYSIFSLAD